MSDQARCQLCGEPMPPGEEMFNYHGYSGDCPKPPLPKEERPKMDLNDYFNRYFGILIKSDLPVSDNPPPAERGHAIAGLAQAHATCAAQLMFNLAPDVEMNRERLQEVASAALGAMRDKLAAYRAARN